MLTKNRLAMKYFVYSRFIFFALLPLMIMTVSCGTDQLQRSDYLPDESMPTIKYSIVCFIHGDGDYYYHDLEGKKYKADEVVLSKMRRVGEQNPDAEVFIYHQKPREHFLLFFPIIDGDFYYYRHGKLFSEESYWRDSEKSNYDTEINFYRLFNVNNKDSIVNMFLYFGHEIPEISGAGYDASYPERNFNINDFAGGLKNFTKDFKKFDLTILSTCYGGTPFTISAIAPYTKYIIASPENLHLSYFDLKLMEKLDFNKEETASFAEKFAEKSFNSLSSNLQTAISVAVYDTEEVKGYLNWVEKLYTTTLASVDSKNTTLLQKIERCDCIEIPEYIFSNMQKGVKIYYRPAKFGRLKNKQNHSGWECLRLIE